MGDLTVVLDPALVKLLQMDLHHESMDQVQEGDKGAIPSSLLWEIEEGMYVVKRNDYDYMLFVEIDGGRFLLHEMKTWKTKANNEKLLH